MKKSALILLLVLCFSTILFESSADIYVYEGATGSNTGANWANAYYDFPSVIPAGETVWVAEGVYYGNWIITGNNIQIRRATAADHGENTTWNSSYEGLPIFRGAISTSPVFRLSNIDNFLIEGNVSDGLRIDDTDHTINTHLIIIETTGGTSSDNITFRNLIFIQDNNSLQGIIDNRPSGGTDSSNGMTVENCSFSDSYYSIMFSQRCSNITISHSVFTLSTAIPGSIALYGAGNGHQIHDNRISNYNTAISYSQVSGGSIYHNIFTNSASTVFNLDSTITALTLHGNLLYNTGSLTGTGAGITSSADNLLVYNNTIAGFNRAINLSSSVSGNNIANNIFYNNASTPNYDLAAHSYNWYSTPGVPESGTEQISASNPFVNAAAGNYHLTDETVPGDSTIGSIYSTDMDGQDRDSDCSWDRGAFEHIILPAISTDHSSFSFSAHIGGTNPSAEPLEIFNSGDGVLSWITSISYGSGSGWLSLSPSTGTLSSGAAQTTDISVSLAALSAPGTYTAVITVNGQCPNIASKTVNVSFTVGALDTAPGSFSFNATQGGANPSAQILTISNMSISPVNWYGSVNYTSGSGWLFLSSSNGSLAGSGSATPSVSVNIGAMTAGTYEATILVDNGTSIPSIEIPVSLDISPPSYGISLSPGNFIFSGTAGGPNPSGQSLSIGNTGTGAITWNSSLSYNPGNPASVPGLVSVSPASGTLSGGASASATINVNLASVSISGTYSGSITIADTGGSGSSGSVNFTITVNAPIPVIAYSLPFGASALSFTATEGGSSPATQLINIWNSGAGTLTWNATNPGSASWLTLTTAGGDNTSTGASDITQLQVSVDTSALTAGSYSEIIRLSAPSALPDHEDITLNLSLNPSSIGGAFDVVIVMDKSGSMIEKAISDPADSDTKIQALRDVAENAVELFRTETGSKVGMVQFNADTVLFGDGMNDTLRTMLPDTGSGSPQDLQIANMTGVIGSISAGGRTSIGDGLNTAIQYLNTAGDPGHEKYILLVTDGKENEPLWIGSTHITDNVKQSVVDSGAHVMILGLGYASGLNSTDLTILANDTQPASGPVLNFADTTMDFKKSFLSNVALAMGMSAPMDPVGKIAPEEVIKIPVLVTPDQSSAYFNIFWDKADGAVIFRLIAPNGKIITPSMAQKFKRSRYKAGKRYAFYQLNFPLDIKGMENQWSGEWTMLLQGDPKAMENRTGVNYGAISFAKSNLKMNSRILAVEQKEKSGLFETGTVLKISADLSLNQKPLTGAKVYVEGQIPAMGMGNILHEIYVDPKILEKYAYEGSENITLAQSKVNYLATQSKEPLIPYKVIRIELNDSGIDGDERKGDGIYTAIYKESVIPGTYKFRFVAENIPLGEKHYGRREWTDNFLSEPGYDREASKFNFSQVAPFRTYVLYNAQVLPRDRFGNMTGPGYPVSVRITSTGFDKRGKEPVARLFPLLNEKVDGFYENNIALPLSVVEAGFTVALMIGETVVEEILPLKPVVYLPYKIYQEISLSPKL